MPGSPQARRAPTSSLRTVGCDDRCLRLIAEGSKTSDLRLATDPDTRDVCVGDEFVFANSARRVRVRVLAVDAYVSLGRALNAQGTEIHGLLPRSLGLTTLDARLAFYQSFYHRDVVSTPTAVRVLCVERVAGRVRNGAQAGWDASWELGGAHVASDTIDYRPFGVPPAAPATHPGLLQGRLPPPVQPAAPHAGGRLQRPASAPPGLLGGLAQGDSAAHFCYRAAQRDRAGGERVERPQAQPAGRAPAPMTICGVAMLVLAALAMPPGRSDSHPPLREAQRGDLRALAPGHGLYSGPAACALAPELAAAAPTHSVSGLLWVGSPLAAGGVGPTAVGVNPGKLPEPPSGGGSGGRGQRRAWCPMCSSSVAILCRACGATACGQDFQGAQCVYVDPCTCTPAPRGKRRRGGGDSTTPGAGSSVGAPVAAPPSLAGGGSGGGGGEVDFNPDDYEPWPTHCSLEERGGPPSAASLVVGPGVRGAGRVGGRGRVRAV